MAPPKKATTPKKKKPPSPSVPPKPRLLADAEDYRQLKVYFDGGCCNILDSSGRVVKGMSPLEVIAKFPQFASFEYSSVNSVVQRLRGQARDRVADRQAYGNVNTHRKSNSIVFGL